MKSSEELSHLIRAKYNVLNDARVIAISVADLAENVYEDIDPQGLAPELVRSAAVLELRQLARAICRSRQVSDENQSQQGSLFEQLQPRYPNCKGDTYILREHLTLEDRQWNIERLRKEANVKLIHADALAAETEHLVSIGKLNPALAEVR
jgi:hypothetical protein